MITLQTETHTQIFYTEATILMIIMFSLPDQKTDIYSSFVFNV